MGVTGLWRLIDPAGKPVPVETLENKVLAVDISIWLHQMVKGYQDAKGAPLQNAHLMGLFQRLCKLLYFRIKPVFVFDGGFPVLKRETIAKRQDAKAKYNSESERIKRELAILLSKKTAVNSLLGKQISPKQSTSSAFNNDDLFKLPALPPREEDSESESEGETSSGSFVDLHSVDMESDNFKNMSVKEKYDLLIELKETRKLNSWGKLHELPKKSDSFSDFQMQRLLKRRKVQECLEETEKEMGDIGMSLNELESLLNEEGIDTKIDNIPTRRIASNETTRFLLIKDVKQALAEARKRKEEENNSGISKVEEKTSTENVKLNDELEDDLQKAIKMSLECVDDQNVSGTTSKTDDSWTSCMTDSEDSYSYGSDEDDGFEQPDNMATAKAYIMQYSDFTHKVINNLVSKKRVKNKQKVPKVDQILEELNNEKSFIVDNIELSSGDEDCIEDKIEYQSSELNTQNTVSTNSEGFASQSKNNLDTTQASVVCIENQQDIIVLDTSTEEMENETVEAHQTRIKQDPDSSDQEFEDVCASTCEGTNLKPQIKNSEVPSNKNESDSSDTEFEEVPEIDKPIVQLTLNMGDAPDDDIFADIFDKEKETITKEINVNMKRISPQMNSKNNVVIEDTILNENSIKVVDNHDTQNGKAVIRNNKTVKDKDSLCKISNIQEISITDTIAINENSKVDIKKSSLNEDITKAKEQPVALSTTGIVTNLPKEVLNTEKLNSLVEEMQNEEQGLMQEKGRLDRIGRNITEQMTKEAQELLQIFGIPYIVAPMEAEAQCAFLENANLTDGTITDDSDIWLFGGRTVYKNFFNQKKHVMQFLSDRIEKSFNLNREQLVLLALLVGSDYTTGLSGVGPVTALEILASFPFNKRQLLNETSKQEKYTQIVKGLQEFKQWVRAGKRTDNITLKKKLKNVNMTNDFPSARVVQAYLEPNIEKSEEKLTWGEFDITVLRDYTKAKFGWSQNKLDEIIKPVLKRMKDRKTQRSVQDFFKRKVNFQSLDDQMSKRVKAAVQRMGPEKPLEDDNSESAAGNKPAQKRTATRRKNNAIKNMGEAGPSSKLRKNEDSVLNNHGVIVVSEIKEGQTEFEIKIPKSDRFQEIIPQREKEKQGFLQNKMKAIEVFRKTNIDRRKKNFKKKAIQPKEKADLSETDSD